MSKKETNRNIDDNFFRAMNYEIGEELGILNNEDINNPMKIRNVKNRKIKSARRIDDIINPS
jgi:hypothetical protein